MALKLPFKYQQRRQDPRKAKVRECHLTDRVSMDRTIITESTAGMATSVLTHRNLWWW